MSKLSAEVQDARNAAYLLRAAGAKGETLTALADSIIARLPPVPRRRSDRARERAVRVRAGDLVLVQVDLGALADCDVVLHRWPP